VKISSRYEGFVLEELFMISANIKVYLN